MPKIPPPTTDVESGVDWERVASLLLLSRELDTLEERELVPQRLVPYLFSARGHELAQIVLGSLLTHPHDSVSVYYRSRPLVLTLGVSAEEALSASMARAGGQSDGRDGGPAYNALSNGGATVLPMTGDVGGQYTPAVGWAEALGYRLRVMGDRQFAGGLAAVCGGDGAVASNGFWSALNTAATRHLPLLFLVEDNGLGFSVPSELQTPGGNIVTNLAAFTHLRTFDGDGTDPAATARILTQAVAGVRTWSGPALVRLSVPRLAGHSAQDSQSYREAPSASDHRDPLIHLSRYLIPAVLSQTAWDALERQARDEVKTGLARALARRQPDPRTLQRFVFAERQPNGEPELQAVGGPQAEGHRWPTTSSQPRPTGPPQTLVQAIRRTLRSELESNPRLVVFGQDVGAKGGVYGATAGLQQEFGADRVFDTSLSEEGIIGRAIGMALAGLTPVPEIQFRKFADAATIQLSNCGTMRWRTANRFAAPIVVRMPAGFARYNDPWHSVSGEAEWVHRIGWQVVFPSNAQDAVGLLRAAMRSNNPTLFFEQRELLTAPAARRPYPGDDYVVPFGEARRVREGTDLTVVTWGAMVDRCERASAAVECSVEILDLRTLQPWDRDTVISSVSRTNRCLIVHEDTRTAGFGAEIAATLVSDALTALDAPVERLTMPDIPCPFNARLVERALPSVEQTAERMHALSAF